jgi:hypothetical protein
MPSELLQAAATRDLPTFLRLAFPPEWAGIAARIVETGAELADGPCPWAPRWSKIPPTVRRGADDLETAVKSVIYRVHDCLHQLWGLPHPGAFTDDDASYYKRAQMCGEVAVLTLTELVYCDGLRRRFPALEPMIRRRNATPLLDGPRLPLQGRSGPLAGKSVEQIAMRLDDLLHKQRRPRWVREDPVAMAFCDDYVPMLAEDRRQIDCNWAAMRAAGWTPEDAPKARFGRSLDGLELTVWMIRDFEHLLSSSTDVDQALAAFNRERRARIVLPPGWAS